MTLDELLLEWSYRSEKGYPSLDNPSDVSILENILNELDLPTHDIIHKIKEQVTIKTDDEIEDDEPKDLDGDGIPDATPSTGGSEVYDTVIRKHLGLSNDEPIPKSKNSYPFPGSGGSTFNIQVKPDDMKYWKEFWPLTPPKEGQTEGGTKAVGNGEISLYWLYQHSNSSVDVKDTRGSDNPDLTFDGVGVEVKAYPKHNGKHGLGRFGQDREQLKMLGVIFGINSLSKQFKGASEGKNVNPLTWDGGNLKDAMEEVIKFTNVDLEQLAGIYDIFSQIKSNIDFLEERLGEFKTAEEGARKMSLEFVKPKIARKPGDGGFLANVLENGNCRFWQIDYSKVVNNEDSLNHIKATQGSMQVDFERLFG